MGSSVHLAPEGRHVYPAERKDNQILIAPKKLGGKAFQKVLAVMDRVNEKNKSVSEETVVKYATQAIAELREEEYAKSHRIYANKK